METHRLPFRNAQGKKSVLLELPMYRASRMLVGRRVERQRSSIGVSNSCHENAAATSVPFRMQRDPDLIPRLERSIRPSLRN
jgi:hypothetical protein